jgi:hypothetical protein
MWQQRLQPREQRLDRPSAGHDPDGGVFRVFAENTERMRELALRTVAALDLDRSCPCPNALDGIQQPVELP